MTILARLLAVIMMVVAMPHLLPAQATTPMPADGTPIADVRVEGTNRLAPAELLRPMELRAGGAFNADALRRDLQALANNPSIDPLTLRIDWEPAQDGAVNLVVRVRENPVIGQIDIVGNSRFKQKQILSQLGYGIGDIVPSDVRAATIRNLQSFYRDGGFKTVRVSLEQQPLEGAEDQVRLLITINEGARIKIKDVDFNGNTHFNTFFFQYRLMNSPGILVFDSYFDESAVEDDLALIREAYREAGYLDASVELGNLEYNEDKRTIRIVYTIVQGPRYRVSDVTTEGVTYFTEDEIDRVTSPLEDRTFKGRRLTKATDRIRRLYGDQGYVDTDITYRLDKNPEARSVRVILPVKESSVVYVGRVYVDMEDYEYDVELNAFDKVMDKLAPPTKPETVMKEVRLNSGDKYRTSDEARTVQRLRNLGIFRKVNVVREPTAEADVRDARIVVEDDPNSAFIGASVGVGEYSGPSATLRFQQPNVGGRADKFTATATVGERVTAFSIGYFDRYLGDSEYSLDTQLYHERFRLREYNQRTTGASTEVGRPISEYLTGYNRLRFERVDFSGYDNDVEEDMDGYWVAATRPMLVYDKRDSSRFPTDGYLVSGGFETGVADGFLFKILHAYEWYKKPLPKSDLVYAYQHSVGLMPYDAREIGLGERFFVGGTSTLRGFKWRGVGPTDGGNDDLFIGGSTRLTQRHELRYPFNEFVTGRVFTDAAILERSAFTLGPPRIGSGVGAILNFGPLLAEVDFAVPVLRESGDQTQFFHLKLGSNL